MTQDKSIAVLFARRDSIYKTLPYCDVYDEDRNAATFPGGKPIVAHPPCRGWGRLRHMSNATEEEKAMGLWAVGQVRKWGGVLEHPKASQLWPAAFLPPPGRGMDEHGGWTLGVPQQWWGHRAEKMTLLYICGCFPKAIPPIPLTLGEAEYVVGTSGRRLNGTRCKHKKEISKAEREHTPLSLALWLCEVARRCSRDGAGIALSTGAA